MRAHGDFANGINPSVDDSMFQPPNFRFVKSQPDRAIVLVLDKSGSMGKPMTKINSQNQVSGNYNGTTKLENLFENCTPTFAVNCHIFMLPIPFAGLCQFHRINNN